MNGTEKHFTDTEFFIDILFHIFDYLGLTGPNKSKVPCGGRLCTRCGLCRDWFFNGSEKDWDFVRTWERFTSQQWKEYRSNRVFKDWNKRQGASCSHDNDEHLGWEHENGKGGLRHHCVCRDNNH